MHILYVADGDLKYGALNSLLQLVSEMARIDKSVKVSVVLPKHSNIAPDFKRIGCDVYQIFYEPFYHGIPYKRWKLPAKFLIYGILYICGRIFAIKELEKRLNINKVDIIHSNSSREDFGASLARKYNKPFIWHIREFGDLDYECFSFRRDYISLMNKSATEFIAISKAIKEHWIHKGIQREKIIQIYNGVKKNEKIKKHYPEKEDVIRLIMMGSINETKGQHCIIQAIAMLPEIERKRVQLDIVGDGSVTYIKKLQYFMKENDIAENIHFLGYHKDFYKQLSRYDCGVMCSRCEAFGRVSAEYMMVGLPVIASDTGANPELIKDNMNGLLYQYNNIEDLAEKISYFLNNEAKIEELGRNAYEIAVKKYTASINAFQIYHEYKRILKEWKK